MTDLTTTFQSNAPQTVTRERDEFDSAEFEGGREALPYLQMLNHPDPNQAGFFITLENMEACGFVPNEDWVSHTTRFQSGETAPGYRSLTARFLILHKSKLLMFDGSPNRAKHERDSGEFLGLFQKSRYDRTTMVLKTRYLVFLVGKQRQLLHDKPLLFTTKGSFCGNFGEVVRKFQSDMSKAYGTATGARKPRGERFMALSILAVQVQPELKGERKQSWVCSIANYGAPTVTTWKAYFVGYSDLKSKILADYEAWMGFGSPEQEIEAQQRRQTTLTPEAEPVPEREAFYDDDDAF